MIDPEQNPYFSIIVPVFNRANFISNLIESVLLQSFKNFELIIVDDGSTDSLASEITKFYDARIFYYKIPNCERGAARNYGASKAKGLYFNFFDSDDVMYANHLSAAFRFIEENKSPRWFHTQYRIVDIDGRTESEVRGFKDPCSKLIETNYLGCDSVFIDRALFLNNLFQEDRRLASSEDWELWLRIISQEKLAICEEVTFQIMNHGNRSLFTISADRIIERDQFMFQCLFQNNEFQRKFKNQIPLFEADRYTFYCLSLLIEKRRKLALFYFFKSLKTSVQIMKRRRFWACIKIFVLGL